MGMAGCRRKPRLSLHGKCWRFSLDQDEMRRTLVEGTDNGRKQGTNVADSRCPLLKEWAIDGLRSDMAMTRVVEARRAVKEMSLSLCLSELTSWSPSLDHRTERFIICGRSHDHRQSHQRP